jgi:hypothetical protein
MQVSGRRFIDAHARALCRVAGLFRIAYNLLEIGTGALTKGNDNERRAFVDNIARGAYYYPPAAICVHSDSKCHRPRSGLLLSMRKMFGRLPYGKRDGFENARNHPFAAAGSWRTPAFFRSYLDVFDVRNLHNPMPQPV